MTGGMQVARVNRTVRDFENGLISLLEKVPFDRITVDQICQEAMLHRSSFYRYFHDKYDLLAQTIDGQLNKLISNQQTTDGIVDAILNYVDHHQELFHHLVATKDRPGIHAEILQIISDLILHRSQRDNNDLVLQAVSQSDQPELMSYMIGGSINGAFMWWQKHNYDVSREEVAKFCKQQIHNISNSGRLV
jgi:AcrR family transcriptional regulator